MNLLESHIEGIHEFPTEERESLYRAVIEYMYYGVEPDYLKGPCKGYFIGIKPVLDNSIAKSKAGRKGGKQSAKQKRSKCEANRKQTGKQTPSDSDSDSDSEELAKANSKEIEQVVTYLNEATGRQFKVSKKTASLVNARLNEGYSFTDFQKVIDNKNDEWGSDPVFSRYLQPSTLFAPSHFDEYLNQTTPKVVSADERFAKYAD